MCRPIREADIDWPSACSGKRRRLLSLPPAPSCRGLAMKLPLRRVRELAAGVSALPAVSRFAKAQAYPSRPVRLIVGLAAGGGQDIVARLIGQWLSERLGSQF